MKNINVSLNDFSVIDWNKIGEAMRSVINEGIQQICKDAEEGAQFIKPGESRTFPFTVKLRIRKTKD